MAVYRSSGDGYALYNGVKLPSLSALSFEIPMHISSEECPYWIILRHSEWSYSSYRVFTSKKPLFVGEDGIIHSFYDGSVNGFVGVRDIYVYMGDDVVIEEEVAFDRWYSELSEWTGEHIADEFTIAWANYDLVNSADDSIYFPASEDPIPLDGMNVIEWDGDITQGWEDGEGIWDRGDGMVIIAPYAKASNAIAVYGGELCTEFSDWEDGWEVYNNNEDSEHYEVCAVVTDTTSGGSGGICARYDDEQLYTSLIAYTPIEEPTTVDYTITYETEHGTAPTSKTVTVNEGESYTLTADDLPTLEAEGYIFKGWSANVGDTISADTTLTAVWEEVVKTELLNLYLREGGQWVKKEAYKKSGNEWVKQQFSEAYQRIDGEWVKIAPNPTPKPYLTFSSARPFSMGVQNAQKNWDGTLYYSTDTETWSEWDGTTSIESEYAGSGHLYPHRLYMRGVGNSVITGELWRGFVFTDNAICCDGNIESLLDCDMVAKGEHPRMSDFCFAGLFHSTGLITPPHLPSTDLSRYCYYCMFYSAGLVVLPTLPATTLQEGCYVSMFAYCSYIKMSTTLDGGYSEPYRIPPFGTADSNPNNNRTSGMFNNTGGKFKGTPAINTTYYALNDIR